MEEPMPEIDDIAAVQQAAHRLIVRYGSRAAEIARSRARTAPDIEDEQAWLDVADAIDRDLLAAAPEAC
jgi:hypothetical protein